jgi:hypothetical protein
MANDIIETEDMLSDMSLSVTGSDTADRRRMDLALNLVDQYFGFVAHWQWGDSILEWIRQCEITFGARMELRNLMRNDVWPHAGRSSFVTLLEDKHVEPGKGVDLERAVGIRLTFRQPPPIGCFSNQFLFYLNSTLANTAYQTWSHMSAPISCLPPERFAFEVLKMDLQ